jgi:hypothetical protein
MRTTLNQDLEDIQTTTAKLKSETGENLLARTWLERRWEWMTATWGSAWDGDKGLAMPRVR